jgi:ankyrin repeat protein
MSANTELLEACKVGDITALSTLLKDNEANKEPLLNAAARANQVSVLKYLFTLDPSTKISHELILSALAGGTNAYKTLYEHDASILNHDLGHLGDALTNATMSQNLELVTFLLSKGVDPNESRMGYRAVIDIAAGYSTLEIVKALLSHDAKVDGTEALRVAVQKGRPDVLRILCESGADVNAVFNSDGTFAPAMDARGTALRIAAAQGQDECVMVLKEFGAA